MKDNFKMM